MCIWTWSITRYDKCVVYNVMQVLGCKIISHMWPNVRSTCLCVYVKTMSYFKFTLIHMLVIDLQVHIYVSWFSLCCKFTYMYVDLVYVARSHLWYSCWLFCKYTPMMFILSMPKRWKVYPYVVFMLMNLFMRILRMLN